MWGGVDLNDGLTAVILYVGRWFLGIIGFTLIGWASVHFLKNLLLAFLGKPVKTGMGTMKFSTYALIFLIGIICTGAILGGSFMSLLNKLYLFLLHFKSQINI
ncbi:hypothetical protein Desaci_4078 [Desulfosporosinus acidiphilus SJ4]|uniref:Uncharacterized protein n=1 Tax=Desulfosporosinus acidiphilus (strain DSM 22704 / JCM 16185 / SJ4) TaxID=646529 RepID=I4DAW7_DESAJ|nr:hypothetical protein [Desulfosporosinus acidiphilus]AFM42941.1 hypothetical protein Desaci_4078 [Desulfosporosinus acidiphilus SJ4]